MLNWRRVAAVAGVAGLGLGGALVAAPANAATGAINCTGWTYATYSPGLTNTTKSTAVVVDGYVNVLNAHSPTGSCLALGSTASSGERHVTAQLNVGCDEVLGVETGVETITWNDGQSTSFSFTANVIRGDSTSQLVETGTVISGEFTGDQVVETFTAPNTDFAGCTTAGGVTSLDFATVLTITPG